MEPRQDDSNPRADNGPRTQIKRAARLLFAERGLRDVTVREIAKAAGQRNLGAVAYYFGAKDRLIAEILTDGAERIEALRRAHLQSLEADGGPHTVEAAVAAIVRPSATFSDSDPIYGSGFNRFLTQLSLNNRTFIDQTLEGRWNGGYQRCLSHLRRLTPQLSAADQSRRFLFLGSYIGGLLASRETVLADTEREHRTWRAAETLDDIIRTAAAILTAPSGFTGDRLEG